MAPRARFELATLRLTAERTKNLSALSGVACKKPGAIFLTLPAPNSAPKQFEMTRMHHVHLRALPETQVVLSALVQWQWYIVL
jgi:hypothetical protein